MSTTDYRLNLDERPPGAGLEPGIMYGSPKSDSRERHGVTVTRTRPPTATRQRESMCAAVEWLEAEFPGWTIDVDRTATWAGELRPLWIARRDGHHPQAELSAAKLHTRLTDYLSREERRNALAN